MEVSSLARGTWIEISIRAAVACACGRRPSQEGRGLKSELGGDDLLHPMSSLARGTWIEI